MTIFDSKPFQINNSSTSAFCDKYDVSTWNFRKSGDFKKKSGALPQNQIKKKVTFADDKGQDLIHVFIIDNSIFPDLKYSSIYEKSNSQHVSPKHEERKQNNPHLFDWVTSFIQPASVYTRFKSELGKKKVKLATAVIIKNQLPDNTYQFEMTGIIRVINLCFEKRVFVRLSSDSKWTSYSDFEGKYKSSSTEFLPDTNETCDIDEFEFQISLPQIELEEAANLEFVIGMETPNLGNYWDNNIEKNYRLDYCQISVDKLANGLSSTSPYTRDYKPNMEPFISGFTGYRAWNHFSEELNFY